MHELSLARNIVRIVEEAADGEAGAVTRVILEIGALSCADSHALEFCFEAVSAGTRSEGARLIINAAPATGRCLACEREAPVFARTDKCPFCGADDIVVVGGEQMTVKAIEVH